MKRERDFHRLVRVVYRACRKIYGKERTQDESIRLFKLVFPLYHKAYNSEDKYFQIPSEQYDKIASLLAEWIPEEGALREVILYVICNGTRVMLREEFLQFCKDITPVVMRIRKLTPMETGRLMGLRDVETWKMMDAGISNSAMYKLHGNSIVVDVMTGIFENLFCRELEERKKRIEIREQSLFD